MANDTSSSQNVNRIPRGYERNANLPRRFMEISKGERPALELRPAQYLPVLNRDNYLNDWVVINAGTIVAVDTSGDLVNANGGLSACSYTYTVNDIGITVDHATEADTYVTAAGASSSGVAENMPIGVAPYDYYQNLNAGYDTASAPGITKYMNYQIQDKVTVLCDYLIEIPARPGTTDASGTIMSGDLVQPDCNGNFVKWGPQGTVEQIVGRCIHRKAIAAVDNLNLVQTVPGLGLSGTATSGIPQHLYNYTSDAAYSNKLLIQLMVS